MTDKNHKKLTAILLLFMLFLSMLQALSCTSGKYLLDQPVSDPIMYADDTQDSDLNRVEDGGYAGASGECPT